MSANAVGAQVEAGIAVARAYGVPVAGKKLSLSFDATDKTLALEADSMYVLYASSDVYLGAADTTSAANQSIYLPSGTLYAMRTRVAFTLHATQVSAAGTLHAGKVVDA